MSTTDKEVKEAGSENTVQPIVSTSDQSSFQLIQQMQSMMLSFREEIRELRSERDALQRQANAKVHEEFVTASNKPPSLHIPYYNILYIQ